MVRPNNTWRLLSILLAVSGILVASYLTFEHYANTNLLCAPGGGCDTVKLSRYSEVFGIPVALIGLLGYLGILGLLILESRSSPLSQYSAAIIFGMTLLGTLYSLYLTYLELFVILAICPYCVASAIIMAVLLGISIYRLAHSSTNE